MTGKVSVLFYSNWGVDEGITHSTVFPILRTLEARDQVEKIIFCTTELRDAVATGFSQKVRHFPIRVSGGSGFNKVIDLIRFSLAVSRMAKLYRIDMIWCRGAPAGGIGLLAHRLSGIPFLVDSFEPHSWYMRDSGTWSRTGFKFLIQAWLEKGIKKRAMGLLPVSYAYFDQLIAEGVGPSRLFVFPCVVDDQRFQYREVHRHQVRTSLSIPGNAIVGIYAGKFGGLYYEAEACMVFKQAFDFWKGRFYLIILSSTNRGTILAWCKEAGIPAERLFVATVDHSEIPSYLSAADFAFSTIKSVEALKYCSPIKHGEYWASDLPVVSTLTSGDDARIMTEESGGYLLSTTDGNTDEVFSRVDRGIQLGRTGKYTALARKYRDFSMIGAAVSFALNSRLNKNR